MTEAEARAEVDRIMNDLNRMGEAANGTFARECFTTALLSATRPAPGYIRTSEGADMRLFGEWDTASGTCRTFLARTAAEAAKREGENGI